ncbi:poly-gamma-glutamate synthesis protein (capsule biosynthesis protein) [Alkalibacillus flavidus]|uniref:Poly-gamma-glutamate synthesis protein (Capsule biosynthesis protein) n=1 Tax=Alkalibacillus flavidus TaxID=546021 RepID=A0ABV2KSX8_9BACI
MKQLIIWTVVTLMVFITLLIYGLEQQNSQIDTVTARDLHNISNRLQKDSPQTSITLNAVGDILMHERVYRGAEQQGEYVFTPMLEPVMPHLQEADITFANQETMLAGETIGLSGYPRFNAPSSVADALSAAPVDIVSIANNHTLDHGREAVMQTTELLNDHEIDYVGAYRSYDDQQSLRVIEQNGISVGFTGYTYGTNGLRRPDGDDYLVQYMRDGTMVDDIQQMKDEVDFTVVSLHFGNEYEPFPTEEQRQLVQKLTEAGADIILGHHPHVLQPVDIVKTDHHESVVIYSLGNFLSGQMGLERRIGGVLQLELTKGLIRPSETSSVTNIQLMPTFVEFEQNGNVLNNVSVVPLANSSLPDADTIFDDTMTHMQTYTNQLDVVPKWVQVQ